MQAERPLPTPAGWAAHYWRAAARGTLLCQRCGACGAVVFPARIACPVCGSDDVPWEESSGNGTVYSFTVVRQSRHPYFGSRTPYVLALIDVEPGFRMMSNVVEVDPEAVRVGMPVRVTFENHGADVGIPLFVPVPA